MIPLKFTSQKKNILGQLHFDTVVIKFNSIDDKKKWVQGINEPLMANGSKKENEISEKSNSLEEKSVKKDGNTEIVVE